VKLRRIIFGGGAFFLILVKFTLDVIGKNIELGGLGITLLREFMTLGAFVLLFLASETDVARRDQSPVKKLGFLLLATMVLILLTGVISAVSIEGFDTKDFALLPLDYMTIFAASLLSVLLGFYATVVVRVLRDLITRARKRSSRRNYYIYLGLVFATAGSTLMMKPLESGLVNTVLFVLATVVATINAFRLPWIVYLTKREKVFGLIYSFVLFLCFTWIDVLFLQGSNIGNFLTYYSYPLREFVQLTIIGANIYFGMAFISTLFHLPTADAFERKRSEVTSLSTLSKLVTQALDFKELIDTVTSMTMEVCEASGCWLEVIYSSDEETPLGPTGAKVIRTATQPSYLVQVAGTKNITQEEIDELVPTRVLSLRDEVLRGRKSIVVDNIGADPRITTMGKARRHGGSIAIVPLLSHVGLIGILYATKETTYGFGKEDLEMISAFADQASIALENSRLIKKSIERERLLREMLVAQEMQRKLLPQDVPASPALELDAVSTPAFEVGGDYYDFMQIDPTTIGIVVGDVSGKGVSAAFYMSEVKGIFQALGRMYTSPREFMMKANEALASSIDKHSFVSLIYALVDTSTGTLTLSRAGHCPMLHVFDGGVRYVRPNGIGLGLTQGELFDTAIEEESIQLSDGDVCLFYTDGLTEARHGTDEFGYERLKGLTQRIRSKAASAIKEEIIESVKDFVEDQVAHDDLTVVVLKWHGNGSPKSSHISNVEEAQ